MLVDCGFSAREVSRRLAEAGIDASDVSAVLVTHDHGDHVRGLDVFCRRQATRARVIATAGTLAAAATDSVRERAEHIANGQATTVGSFEVRAFATSHDSLEPVGFRICTPAGDVGVLTDSGTLTPEAAEALTGVDILALEANHDPRMLETGPYPWHLKRRIASRDGHLSNVAAADALERLASPRLTHVVGVHRSQQNNTSELAQQALEESLGRLGARAAVTIASQSRVLEACVGGGEA